MGGRECDSNRIIREECVAPFSGVINFWRCISKENGNKNKMKSGPQKWIIAEENRSTGPIRSANLFRVVVEEGGRHLFCIFSSSELKELPLQSQNKFIKLPSRTPQISGGS